MENSVATDTPFYKAYRGRFVGLRTWDDLDNFWQVLKQYANQNWYIYAIGETVPDAPVCSEQLQVFIHEINTLLHQEHQEDYCGIVYVDDKVEPSFIKIYDPNNLGVSCGFSENPPLPGWILSKLAPLKLTQSTFVSQNVPQNRKRWWRNLFPS